jgi:hypothetical protein
MPAHQQLDLSFLLEANWPKLPPATAEVGKNHHNWLGKISKCIQDLLHRVDILENENRTQKETIATLNTLVNSLKQQEEDGQTTPQTRGYSNGPKASFASILKSDAKKNEADMVMITQVTQEFKEREKIERNLIVHGIDENDGSEQENLRHDKSKIEGLLDFIGIDKTVCKRITRIKNRKSPSTNTPPNYQERPKPGIIIIELSDKTHKKDILLAAKSLQDSHLKNVYINPDKTPTERALDRKLREEKKSRNDILPHAETINGVTLKYEIVDGKRWFWGIRNDRLVRVLHKADRDI